ncbi:hypothetical protein [Pedobacter boryungensis]|uniref:Uncharacterized protein n=1 Tax=Pedobacter boryungensis TaxID=869962 RepID=A0ABX2DHX8_9SPHI|nr:hypothetical protein [Pedobacter boryungensis]NQX33144.1 hypothetical protein [Pedobacter boryungensis]
MSQLITGPYLEESQNKIYHLLFGDDLELISKDALSTHPLNLLNKGVSDEAQMLQIANDPNVDSRYRLLFWKELFEEGVDPAQMEVLGVVVEVGLENGLDVVAAYKDGSCRYINHTGKTIFYDSPNEESLKLTTDLLNKGEIVAGKIGPWYKPRRDFPEKGTIRLSFLANNGLYFGEGNLDVMYKDEMAAPVIDTAIALMNYLIDRVLAKN